MWFLVSCAKIEYETCEQLATEPRVVLAEDVRAATISDYWVAVPVTDFDGDGLTTVAISGDESFDKVAFDGHIPSTPADVLPPGEWWFPPDAGTAACFVTGVSGVGDFDDDGVADWATRFIGSPKQDYPDGIYLLSQDLASGMLTTELVVDAEPVDGHSVTASLYGDALVTHDLDGDGQDEVVSQLRLAKNGDSDGVDLLVFPHYYGFAEPSNGGLVVAPDSIGGPYEGSIDVTGDGYTDLHLYADYTYCGGADLEVSMLESCAPGGHSLASDFNSDGIGDLLMATTVDYYADPYEPYDGLARVWYGPVDWNSGVEDRDPDLEFTDETGHANYGISVAAADVDGNGFADLAIGYQGRWNPWSGEPDGGDGVALFMNPAFQPCPVVTRGAATVLLVEPRVDAALGLDLFFFENDGDGLLDLFGAGLDDYAQKEPYQSENEWIAYVFNMKDLLPD